jgi:hypothetical protein
MDFWNGFFGIGGLVIGFLGGILIPLVLYWLTVARGPRVYVNGNGLLCRCLTPQVFREGWGIIAVNGKVTVSHKPVTIVDAELSFKMDKKQIRPSTKSMGDGFPPLHTFVRVGNDEAGSMPALPRRLFTPVTLTPGEGEQPINVRFALGGHFAEEYSQDFFSGKLSARDRMFITMMIRFEYENNGRFYWSKRFKILVHPNGRQGWTPQGPLWIDDDGQPVEVRYGQAVEQPPDRRT